MDGVKKLTRQEILTLIHNEMLDKVLRAEIDLEFWTSMELDPRASLDGDSRKNVVNQKQQNKTSLEGRGKILKIIERKINEATD